MKHCKEVPNICYESFCPVFCQKPLSTPKEVPSSKILNLERLNITYQLCSCRCSRMNKDRFVIKQEGGGEAKNGKYRRPSIQ